MPPMNAGMQAPAAAKDAIQKPQRGQRTATNKATRGGEIMHPQSHDAWEKLGS